MNRYDVASDVGVNFKNVGVLSFESSLFHLCVCLEILTKGRSPLLSLFDVFKQLLTLHKLTPTSDATSIYFVQSDFILSLSK